MGRRTHRGATSCCIPQKHTHTEGGRERNLYIFISTTTSEEKKQKTWKDNQQKEKKKKKTSREVDKKEVDVYTQTHTRCYAYGAKPKQRETPRVINYPAQVSSSLLIDFTTQRWSLERRIRRRRRRRRPESSSLLSSNVAVVDRPIRSDRGTKTK